MSRLNRLPIVSKRYARMLSVLNLRTFNPDELDLDRLSFRIPFGGFGLTFSDNLSGDRIAFNSRLGSTSWIGASCCCWIRERKLILE